MLHDCRKRNCQRFRQFGDRCRAQAQALHHRPACRDRQGMKKLVNSRLLVKHRLNYYTERQFSQALTRWKYGRKNLSVGPFVEDITTEKPRSGLSRRLLADIARESAVF